MNNNKQSSVEWLCERLALKLGIPIAISFYIDYAEEINQAKAMHKNEIENAFDNGTNAYYDLNSPSNCEQYYNETYGGNQ